ncbi:MAG: neutral zinc metallopeptidase [Pseudomonadota bacterium]
MRWRGRRTSSNISDLRGGGGRGRRAGRRAGGLGLIGIVVLLVGFLFGVDLSPILGLMQGGGPGAPAPTQVVRGPNAIDDETEEFIAVVLADTEDVWAREFEKRSGRYQAPNLVLFSGSVHSACGSASSAIGPFYCPADSQVFLDTSFFQTLEHQLGAKGDFARAYVIAHEVGHHVQNLIGVMEQTHAYRQRASEREANAMSVRVELQADCFAGLWARGVQEMFGVLERGDIAEAMNAASRIGDDVLQGRGGGEVVPDSFTHGTSEQRQRWFMRGFETGRMEDCNTFETDRL